MQMTNYSFDSTADDASEVYQADLIIIPPVFEDTTHCDLCPTCEKPMDLDNDRASCSGMLAGAEWSLNGGGARAFFLLAEAEYLSGLSRGVYIETFPLLFEGTVPTQHCDSAETIDCYINGFGIGVAQLLALYLITVDAKVQLRNTSPGKYRGN